MRRLGDLLWVTAIYSVATGTLYGVLDGVDSMLTSGIERSSVVWHIEVSLLCAAGILTLALVGLFTRALIVRDYQRRRSVYQQAVQQSPEVTDVAGIADESVAGDVRRMATERLNRMEVK